MVPAEQVAETIFTSVTLNSLSPPEADADAAGALAEDGVLAEADAEAGLQEPFTST